MCSTFTPIRSWRCATSDTRMPAVPRCVWAWTSITHRRPWLNGCHEKLAVAPAGSPLAVSVTALVNEPFTGSYTPIRHFGRDNNATSVMVELRRDVYLRQDGSMDSQAASRINAALVAILGS